MIKNQNRHVIIIGAGLGGLTAAIALEQLGFHVKIYEQAKSLTTIGGGILLWPKGYNILYRLGLKEKLQRYLVDANHGHYFNYHDEFIIGKEFTELYSLIQGQIFPIERSILQNILVDSLKQTKIHFNKTCRAISENEIIFTDNTTDNADIIIGTDGANSIVRQTLNQHATLSYTGVSWWGGILEKEQALPITHGQMQVAFGIGKSCYIWPLAHNKQMWYLALRMPQVNHIQDKNQKRLQDVCENWNSSCQQIAKVPFDQQNFFQPVNEVKQCYNWYNKNTVIIGDAAHVMGPLLGLGACLAFEDAYILAQCLSHNDTQSAFELFQTIRQPHIEAIAKLESMTLESMINDDQSVVDTFIQALQEASITDIYRDLLPLVLENQFADMLEIATGNIGV